MAVKLNKNESVVDYLKSIGEDSSYGARSVLASSIGISNYIGSASQNTQMLNSLKSGSNTNPSETEKKADNVNKLKGVDDSITEKMLSEHSQIDLLNIYTHPLNSDIMARISVQQPLYPIYLKLNHRHF